MSQIFHFLKESTSGKQYVEYGYICKSILDILPSIVVKSLWDSCRNIHYYTNHLTYYQYLFCKILFETMHTFISIDNMPKWNKKTAHC